jgi:hypothetical protein
MPSIEDIIKSDVTKGAAIGIGAALIAVAAIPVILRASRPAARLALKTGILILEAGKDAMAEATELVEDLFAEVQAEIAEERKGPAAIADGEIAAGASEG